jgi:SAM-dependent methyltransferase
MAEQYAFGETEDGVESERLALLATLYDSASHRVLREARPLDGARVLEVGAGNGGVAMWLADQVGPSGHVLATDVDLRFMREVSHPQMEVREHDIVTDPLDEQFDLIHGRLVLLHLFDRAEAVLAKLFDRLSPGGCMVFEEADYATGFPVDSDHPRAASWVELDAAIADGARALGVADSQFGRRLPGLLRSCGLVDVRSTATYDFSSSGSDYRRFDELTWISARAAIEYIPGVTAEQIDAAIDAAQDPTFEYGEMTMVRAVGYRP